MTIDSNRAPSPPPRPPIDRHAGHPRANKETLTERAYHLIRADILNGFLKAGQPLRLEALKERYGLSFSPLREALSRIQSERLVSQSALRGFRVAGASREEMWDTINTRIVIETTALAQSVRDGDDDWEGGVLSAFHSLVLCAERLAKAGDAGSEDDREELERRHHAFHAALIAACGSPLLLEYSSQLYAQTERYRRPCLSVGVGTWAFRDIAGEHRAILEACLSRDQDRAVALLAEHYRRTGRFIEEAG